MTFTRHDNGTVTVDEFPERVRMTTFFLRYADKAHIRRIGFREVVIRCDNLIAAYRLEKRDKARDVFLCRRTRMGTP